MNSHPPHPPRPRLPADRFYWAVLTPELPASVLRRPESAMARAVLDEAFAAHLPVEIARVAPAYSLLPNGSVLACGLPASQLDHDDLRCAITLAPAGLPEWLDQEANPEALNVLTGPYQPAAVTAAKRRRSLLAAAAVALIATGVGIGFERRAAAASDDRRAAERTLGDLLASPAAVRADLKTGDADFKLERELARLRATRNRLALVGVADASDPLAAVLARWPRDLKAQAQSISAAPGQVGVGVQLPGHPETEKLAAALSKTPGWEAGQPQISTNPKGVQVQLTLRPTKGGAP